MKRVTGIGGIFFKSKDPQAMVDWYEKHLGIVPFPGYPCASLPFAEPDFPERKGAAVWSPFKEDTDYFAPSEKPFMINFRVADLDALLAALKDEGVTIVGEPTSEFNGKFGWIVDPEGNKIELWEPAAGH